MAKEFLVPILADTVNEATSGLGVTIEGMLVKDNIAYPETLNVGLNKAAEQRLTVDYGHLRFNVIPVNLGGACSAALAGNGAGNVDDGTHSYTVVFVTASGGESGQPTVHADINVTDKSTDGQVQLTNIPVADAKYGVTARKIYRSKSGQSWALGYLLTTINDNTTTTFLDNVADASLNTADGLYRKEQSHSGSIYLDSTRVMYFGDIFRTLYGYGAGKNLTTGNSNVFLGGNAGAAATTGSNNVYVGYQVAQSIATAASNNIAIGYAAMLLCATSNNIAIGGSSCYSASGSSNAAVGYGSFQTCGSGCVGVGREVGRFNTGSYNIFLGYQAGYGVSGSSTGGYNICIGRHAGNTITSGTYNILIGDDVDLDSPADLNIFKLGKGTTVLIEGDMTASSEKIQLNYDVYLPDLPSDDTETYVVAIDNLTGLLSKRSASSLSSGYWSRASTTVSLTTAGDTLALNTDEKLQFRETGTYICSPFTDTLRFYSDTVAILDLHGTYVRFYGNVWPDTDATYNLGGGSTRAWNYVYGSRFGYSSTHTYLLGGSPQADNTNGYDLYLSGGAATGTGTRGKVYLSDATSGALTNDDTETNLVAYDTVTGLLTYRSVSSIGATGYVDTTGTITTGKLAVFYDVDTLQTYANLSAGDGTITLGDNASSPGTDELRLAGDGSQPFKYKWASGLDYWRFGFAMDYWRIDYSSSGGWDFTTFTSPIMFHSSGSVYMNNLGSDDTKDHVLAIDDSTGLIVKRSVSSLGSSSFSDYGADNQIPVMNGTTDFEYTDNFNYDGTRLEVKASAGQTEMGMKYLPGYSGASSISNTDDFGSIDLASYGHVLYRGYNEDTSVTRGSSAWLAVDGATATNLFFPTAFEDASNGSTSTSFYNTKNYYANLYTSLSKIELIDKAGTRYGKTILANMVREFDIKWTAGVIVHTGGSSTSNFPTSVFRSEQNYKENAHSFIIGLGTAISDTTPSVYPALSLTSDDFTIWSEGGGDRQFRVDRSSGNGYFDGSADVSAADYAEYFEWEDGNPNDEDRLGLTVYLNENGKIEVATKSTPIEKIVGVTSSKPGYVANSAWNHWQGKYKLDKWGNKIIEEVQVYQWKVDGPLVAFPVKDLPKGIIVPDDAKYEVIAGRKIVSWPSRKRVVEVFADEIPEGFKIPKEAVLVKEENGQPLKRARLNPYYNPSMSYTPRAQRKEWIPVGFIGLIRLKRGQVLKPGWMKVKSMSDDIDMYLIK